MDDLMDKELIGMINYTDDTAPMEEPVSAPAEPVKEDRPVVVEKEEMPEFMRKKRNYVDCIAGCAKWMGLCGGIAMLLWWFQINSLMALEAAYPCILACGVLGGYGVGKSVVK